MLDTCLCCAFVLCCESSAAAFFCVDGRIPFVVVDRVVAGCFGPNAFSIDFIGCPSSPSYALDPCEDRSSICTQDCVPWAVESANPRIVSLASAAVAVDDVTVSQCFSGLRPSKCGPSLAPTSLSSHHQPRFEQTHKTAPPTSTSPWRPPTTSQQPPLLIQPLLPWNHPLHLSRTKTKCSLDP